MEFDKFAAWVEQVGLARLAIGALLIIGAIYFGTIMWFKTPWGTRKK